MPKNKFWNFVAKTEDIGELMLYGDISSSSWFGDEVTPKQFKEDMDKLGSVKELRIMINSGGGDVFAGQAIYSMLKRHEAKKRVYIDGLAASIASVIAMAGDEIIMPQNAMMMIHNSWTFAAGNKDDLRKIADSMEKIDETLIGVYEAKTGLDPGEIKQMLDAETWMTADEAVKKGFANEIEKRSAVAASMKGGFLMLGDQLFDLSRYSNPPQITEQPDDSGGESWPVSDSQRKQFRTIRQKINE